MKRTVLTYGLFSGALAVAVLGATIPLISAHTVQYADILGYASIVLAALLVFFGIRSYREHDSGGHMTFGRGFLVGLFITLISCACHVVAFQLIYFHLVPDFGERFTACMIQRVRESGGSPALVEETTRQAAMFRRLFDNPATNAALTFAETFPVGLLATVVSAAILRKRDSAETVR
jgi:hypothetical protein